MPGIVVDGKRPAVEWVTSLPREWRVTESERLVLLCLACDAYEDESAPGYDLVAVWTGMQRSSCAEILTRLCNPTERRPPLLERISVGGRRRTIWRLLTSEPSGHAGQMNRPATPDGSADPAAPEPSGDAGRIDGDAPHANRPATPDANGPNRRRTVGEPSANRPATPDTPFSLLPSPKTQTPSPAATADGTSDLEDPTVTVELDLGIPSAEPPEQNPVQLLVAAYVDRVTGKASSALLGAVGRTVKRLIEKDHFDPALIFAAIEQAAPQGRRDLDRILAAPGGVSARFERTEQRSRMRARWYEIAAAIDTRETA